MVTIASPSIRNDRAGSAVTAATNDWKAIGKVIAVAGEQSDTGTVPPGQDPKAIVLDFVNPAQARRRDLRWGDGRRGSIIPKPGRVRSRNDMGV